MTVNHNWNESREKDEVRQPSGRENAPRFWRGLADLHDTEDAQKFRTDEFPALEADLKNVESVPAAPEHRVSRRSILKYMAASAAMAGLTACTKLPTEKIVPYVRAPEEIVPGKPLFYATSMPFGGEGAGLLLESHMGRPTKVEGNPAHPGSMGHTDIFAQAAILDLYDPYRSQTVIRDGEIAAWDDFHAELTSLRDTWKANRGAGLRILTETIISPTLGAQIRAFLGAFPQAKWHQYEPCGRDNARDGAKMAFGEYVNPVYQFENADVILSLDANFLAIGPGHVRYVRDFSARRSPDSPARPMNRLYVVESTPTITGAMADHRLPMRASEVEMFARMLAANLGIAGAGANTGAAASQRINDWLGALAKDLQAHRGTSLVIAGEEQPATVHALAHAINESLGNSGKTVIYTQPLEIEPVNGLESLRELVGDLNAGNVQTLIVLESNPAYTAPADFDFVHTYLKANQRIHSGLYYDETAELSNWHLPQAHFLESWGDTRAYDGTVGIIQPLIAPLYQGKSTLEMMLTLGSDVYPSAHDALRNYWTQNLPAQANGQESGQDFEYWWETTLNNGVMAGTAFPAKQVTAKLAAADAADGAQSNAENAALPNAEQQDIEIVFRPDPCVADGRFANNSWLQELPKPLSHLTWDNALMLSPATANRLGLKSEDYVNLNLADWKLGAPVWVSPGHADECATLYLGNGRWKTGEVGTRRGVNAYYIRNSRAPYIAQGLQIAKTGKSYSLATTQHHHLIGPIGEQAEEESAQAFERDLIQVANLSDYKNNPNFTHEGQRQQEAETRESLFPGYPYTGYAWGMSIDLNRCVGCNACVVACGAENNVSVVGKHEVLRGREMHWIRVDAYYRGDVENPEMYFEPVPCMQCENAPCELVCPVGATNHSPEGLNNMVYNRCVGTRYCSNNCPYKVRRFNFFLFSDFKTQSTYGMRNPDVTVRSRGVMEKCTYCVQRINHAKINAEEQNRVVRDGEILTACQQVCPADAIVFGNINDKSSQVAKLKAESREYKLLEVLNTRPRTSYLARIRNPNPEMPQPKTPAPTAGTIRQS
jgi:MoCo/4Fe-4S cofactor protein with predicted Tat translocation signal